MRLFRFFKRKKPTNKNSSLPYNSVSAKNRSAKRKRAVRYTLLVSNLIIVSMAGFIVLRHSSGTSTVSAYTKKASAQSTNPLDALSAADIAANASILAGMPDTGMVINSADSIRESLDSPDSANTQLISKPQILSSELKTKYDIINYTTVEGDTLGTLAIKFGVTSDSIKWSNDMLGNNIKAGTKIVVPPVNGIVHTVKEGDTADSLATKYKADKSRIITFNDAELSGLRNGERIVIPDGTISIVTLQTPYYAGFSFGNKAIYGYNGYFGGQCTWWAADRRAKSGRPIPANLGNANAWLTNALRAGYTAGRTPVAGAIIWFNPPAGSSSFVRNDAPTSQTPAYLGHVGYVERVEGNTVFLSDMNWIPRTSRNFTMTMEQAEKFWYIY